MGIWVLNQLEGRFILTDHITVTATGTVLGFQGPADDCGVVLGAYLNEDRGLEIISEIVQAVNDNDRIYKMPEE